MSYRKLPYFWLGISILGLIFTLSFFICKSDKPLSSQRNFFDKTQYLFPKEAERIEDFDLNVVENVFIKSSGPPFLVSSKVLGAFGQDVRNEIEEYIVQEGDNLSTISQKFNISLDTILWANDLSRNSVIKPGQKLIILPTSGILHIIEKGDTLSGIAQIYKGKVNEIVATNALANRNDIFIGDLLIIPGGKRPKISQIYAQVPLPGSYFICPIPSPCRITQGLHWFNAIDFSNGKCGEPVFAAAKGIIQRTGYTSIGGNYVRILHPNGVVTYYGHLSKIAANLGPEVHQGQIIGYVGYSGYTIPSGPAGCHLHFDVRFARNPFAGYGVGTELGK